MGSLAEALTNLEEQRVCELVDQKVNEGDDVPRIISELNEGMLNIGEFFSSGEYFISQLIFSGEILKEVMKKL